MNRSRLIRLMPFALLILFSVGLIKLGHAWHTRQKAWSDVISEIEHQKQRSLETRSVQVNNRWLAKKHKGKDPFYFEQSFSRMQFLRREREAWAALYGAPLPVGIGGGGPRWERLQKKTCSLETSALGRSPFMEETRIQTPSHFEIDLEDLHALISLIEGSQGMGPILMVENFELKRVELEQAEVFLCKFKIIKRVLYDE